MTYEALEFVCASDNDPDGTLEKHIELAKRLKDVKGIVVYRWKTPMIPWGLNCISHINVYSIRVVLLDPKMDKLVLKEAERIGLAFDESDWINDASRPYWGPNQQKL